MRFIKTMEALLKKELNTNTWKPHGRAGGGCISRGEGFLTDLGPVFVKVNGEKGARQMFEGEFASLDAIHKTQTIRVPKPIKVIDNPAGGAYLVMEYMDMKNSGKFAAELGEKLARLHLYNEEVAKKLQRQESSVHQSTGPKYVDMFGFDITTCCGYNPQDNTWNADWVSFFTNQKLKPQIEMIEKEYRDKEMRELWPQLQRKIPELFKDIEVKPALLHGDLWGGNVSETDDGPLIFDPASFYGHAEFEFGIATMFGGFGRTFFDAYHKLIPKSPGFEKRLPLYQLFHYLNHWNHFGTGYRSQSLSRMRGLAK
ncbi:ketosamine-3-kinase [Lingula anatina]|uniref:protein-ribulosamine 3-kinase n=1 Tax=Lingula anatina TaxID=7574 RepID=A0A1S3H3X0_LINAN|nr:ketosamine-3-kinase [Lingula anatina]XP_013379835.1 ketosamine-3-kinase [Lingula anatina]XP_013379836.1 ketosamine-3-kinase [Lingula anatina]|eukprot:XP_013379834.1 ketosamine-3-kinase [Lingula anatina]